MNRSGSAVVIMAKEPVPGKVKTRLCPPLTPREAADLYAAFLLDTVERVAKTPGADLLLAYDPPSAREFFGRMVPRSVTRVSQGAGDLGRRLSRVSRTLFTRGYQKVVILASDTPHLPSDRVRRTFSLLDTTDVVLGPCDDGGYCLVGSRVLEPALFEGIAWSTPAVLEQTTARAEAAGLRWGLLPPCFDIDTIDDLQRLIADLEAGNGQTTVTCPRTRTALEALSHVGAGDAAL